MVDVETGDEPRPLRKPDEEPPARLPERPGQGIRNGRAVKGPSSKPKPAGMPLRSMQREGSTQQTPRSAQTPSPTVETDWSQATFGTDELLWLDEPSGDPVADPGDGSTKPPAWKRGLRG